MTTPKSLEFESFTLDLDRLCLLGPSGPADLRRKSFEVLRYLVEHAGRVVTKEEMLDAVWPDVTVGDESLTQCISEVRRAINDTDQRIIKTIPRRGYLIDVPVVRGGATAAEVSRVTFSNAERASALPMPDKPSIAVLPFANMSGDPEQEHVVDGITEDIITALSRLRWFFVIARNSTFVYKGQAADVRQVGRDLGVRYVLEGSVRKSGQRVRITGQLLDAMTGNHIWSERYDRELTDIFALQDEITASVAAAIEPKLLAAEGMRAETRSINDLDAWDLVARALAQFWRLTAAGSEKAITILQQAVDRHPNYSPAHSMLAFALLGSAHAGWTLPASNRVLATQLAHRALELDDSDPWAHMALGYLAVINHQTDEAVRHFRSALDLNPNFATAHGFMGFALVLDGQTEEALRRFEQAMRMSPRDPLNGWILAGISAAHYLRGRYAEAVACARQAVQLRPGVVGGHRILCASLAQSGQSDEAQAAMSRLRQLQPEISIAVIKQSIPYAAEQMEHFLDGLRKAGLLETAVSGPTATGRAEPPATALPLPERPSIAVLPFANMSGDADQEYFADGMVEDITTELSRFGELFVIARNSSFQYKGKAIDVRQVGRELGVRYVLEGSVRRAEDRIRVAAQLVDAESGGHLWAEKYDHAYGDLFALQDRLTQSVVAAIEPEILIGEGRRAARKSPTNLGAFDCCMRGMWHSNQLGPQDNRHAETWLRRSIELDPKLARAHIMLSRVLSVRCWAGYSDDIDGDLQVSQAAVERALALDDRDPAGHYALAILSVMTRRHERALAAALRAIDLNPNFALGYFALGETRIFMGQFAETIDPMLRCLRLTPRDPFASFYVSLIALAHYHLGDYKEALRYSERALQRRRIYVVLRTLAATLAQLGRTPEARSALAEMDQMKPINVVRHWELTCPYADPAHEGHLLDGLRKAGWVELERTHRVG